MKLRLDRVLQESYEADSVEEALACTPVSIEFEKPEKWTAPYPKYESGWWDSFLPPGSQTSKVWLADILCVLLEVAQKSTLLFVGMAMNEHLVWEVI